MDPLFPELNNQSTNLTTLLHIVPRPRMNRLISCPLHALVAGRCLLYFRMNKMKMNLKDIVLCIQNYQIR